MIANMSNYKVLPKYVRSGAPVCAYLGLSAAGFCKIKQRPDFPKPYRKSQTLSYYKIAELDAWIENANNLEGTETSDYN
jgi:predicted DNA-binding transcriptional regulator AlpA